MDNTSTLRAGTAKAKKLIEERILNQILIPAAKELIADATGGRIALGHNMTGNTVNAYAAGVYSNGTLVQIEISSGSIASPLRGKLRKGQRFYPGDQRWDGEIQEHVFIAQVQTNGSTEAERSIAFLQSHKPTPKGFALVVCNGVEYATFQENEMNIDVLTSNFDNAQMMAPSMFKPMPD